jgi:hypothetical protein
VIKSGRLSASQVEIRPVAIREIRVLLIRVIRAIRVCSFVSA